MDFSMSWLRSRCETQASSIWMPVSPRAASWGWNPPMRRQMTHAGTHNLERVTMNMDRMRVWRRVLQIEYIALAGFQHGKRWPEILVIHSRPRLLIDGPERAFCKAERPDLYAGASELRNGFTRRGR